MPALTETEARVRAALLDVRSYDVFLDLTAGRRVRSWLAEYRDRYFTEALPALGAGGAIGCAAVALSYSSRAPASAGTSTE
jgi:hypothetical protein